MVRHKKDNPKAKKYTANARHTPRRQRDNLPDDEVDSASSGRPSFKAAMWDFDHCDSKRCSGKRLQHFGQIRPLPVGQKHQGVIISPNAKTILSPADASTLEQFGAAVVECSWEEWAEEALQHFSYGESFLKINGSLFKRYAAAEDEAGVKRVEEKWMKRLEKEYSESRKVGEGENGEEDIWAGGNVNRRELPEDLSDLSDSEDDADGENGDDNDEDDDEDAVYDANGNLHQGVPLDLPPDSDAEAEEAEMAEIRRKILASKPFQNPNAEAEKHEDEDDRAPTQKHQARSARNNDLASTSEPPAPVLLGADSDAESGSADNDDEEFDDFDQIANATPVTDRTGLTAKERSKKLERLAGSGNTARFTRAEVSAPKKW
ncbi:ribosome biogenesis protein tsr3 [Lithohypha guttulata]|uniref:Ribosome biogenesis protein tsr3 n=1 Tax=Lithohypha guttulata TaxID=1690604 RepID=A0AAN7SVA8_9EURO|nr:ribosome biogenesis protein tsr3 [Lithohypha guttulata]